MSSFSNVEIVPLGQGILHQINLERFSPVVAGSYAVNPSLFKLAFDPVNDITPVIQLSQGPFLIVAHPALPIKTIKDLIALAKSKPGNLLYASSGQGSIAPTTPHVKSGRLNKILKNKEMQNKLSGDGVSAAGGTSEQFGALIKRDIDTWRRVVKKAGVKVE